MKPSVKVIIMSLLWIPTEDEGHTAMKKDRCVRLLLEGSIALSKVLNSITLSRMTWCRSVICVSVIVLMCWNGVLSLALLCDITRKAKKIVPNMPKTKKSLYFGKAIDKCYYQAKSSRCCKGGGQFYITWCHEKEKSPGLPTRGPVCRKLRLSMDQFYLLGF